MFLKPDPLYPPPSLPSIALANLVAIYQARIEKKKIRIVQKKKKIFYE